MPKFNKNRSALRRIANLVKDERTRLSLLSLIEQQYNHVEDTTFETITLPVGQIISTDYRGPLCVDNDGLVYIYDRSRADRTRYIGLAKESYIEGNAFITINLERSQGYEALTPGEYLYADAYGYMHQVSPEEDTTFTPPMYHLVLGLAVSLTDIIVLPDAATLILPSEHTPDDFTLKNIAYLPVGETLPKSYKGPIHLHTDGKAYMYSRDANGLKNRYIGISRGTYIPDDTIIEVCQYQIGGCQGLEVGKYLYSDGAGGYTYTSPESDTTFIKGMYHLVLGIAISTSEIKILQYPPTKIN